MVCLIFMMIESRTFLATTNLNGVADGMVKNVEFLTLTSHYSCADSASCARDSKIA